MRLITLDDGQMAHLVCVHLKCLPNAFLGGRGWSVFPVVLLPFSFLSVPTPADSCGEPYLLLCKVWVVNNWVGKRLMGGGQNVSCDVGGGA